MLCSITFTNAKIKREDLNTVSSSSLDSQSLSVLMKMEKLLFLTGELFGFTFSLAIKLLNIDDHI
jgi:hypothetical protein